MRFDPTKPIQTRDGRKARILCTDLKGRGLYTLVATILNPDGEFVNTFTNEGSILYGSDSLRNSDLVNIPQRHVHADLMILAANDTSLRFQYRASRNHPWKDCIYHGTTGPYTPAWHPNHEYRVKE